MSQNGQVWNGKNSCHAWRSILGIRRISSSGIQKIDNWCLWVGVICRFDSSIYPQQFTRNLETQPSTEYIMMTEATWSTEKYKSTGFAIGWMTSKRM